MINIEAALREFIAAELARPNYPGACCRIADNWVMTALCFSPLQRAGRDYVTDSDVEAWLSEPGGIAVAVNRVMRKSGLKKTNSPQVGDVGLVFYRQRLCMAIRTASGWLSRDETGIFVAPISATWKAWSIAE